MSKTLHIHVGALGEAIVERYLRKKGFTILERNFRKPWGEIDIIARNSAGIHFVEVKCIQKSPGTTLYRPEENAHVAKLRKVLRTAEGYLLERRMGTTIPWQLDVAAVVLDQVRKEANIRYIERVSLE